MFTSKDVVTVYKKYYRSNYNETLKRYGGFLKANAYDPNIMAEVLLIGNHQARLNDVKKQRTSACKAIESLANAKPWLKTYANFEDIYEDVQRILAGIEYVKGLAIYDVSLRLAAISDLWPTKVYLNAGPLKAAKILLGAAKIKKSAHIIVIKQFPKDFWELRGDEIEDMLCVMGHYDVFSDLKNLNKVINKMSSRSGSSTLFRRNLLGHTLLEEIWEKDSISRNQLTTLSDRLIFLNNNQSNK